MLLSPSSTCESPLSLLCLRLTEVSIFSFILFSSFFPLIGDDAFSLSVVFGFVDDDGGFSVAVVAVAFSVALVAFFVSFAVAAFVGGSSVVFLGDFFLGRPLFFFVGVVPSFQLGLFFCR